MGLGAVHLAETACEQFGLAYLALVGATLRATEMRHPFWSLWRVRE